MSDWDYIVGETNYSQPFVLFDNRTKNPINGTGLVTATMTIKKTDFSDSAPAVVDASMSINTANPLRLLYTITTSNMPQTEGSYLGIITCNYASEKKKTFEIDLRVFRG